MDRLLENLGSLKQPKILAAFPRGTLYCPVSHKLKATRQLNIVRGQVIEYDRLFFKNFVKNEAKRVLPDLFLFFKKALYELSVSGLQLSFIILQQSSSWYIIKNKLYKTLNYQSRDIIILLFRKCLGIVSPSHFCMIVIFY